MHEIASHPAPRVTNPQERLQYSARETMHEKREITFPKRVHN